MPKPNQIFTTNQNSPTHSLRVKNLFTCVSIIEAHVKSWENALLEN